MTEPDPDFPEDPYIGPGAEPDDEPEPLDAQPPQNLAAERAVLGAVMLSHTAWDRVSGVLTPGDFWRPSHATIWATIAALAAAGEPTDAVSVGAALDRAGELRRCGGLPELHTLISEVPTAVNVEHWARLVADKATLRRVAAAGMRIRDLAEAGQRGADVGEVVDFVRREVEAATAERAASRLTGAETAVWSFINTLDSPITGAVHTPWPELDDLLNGGLYPGDLVFVAARPSVGKSLVGNALARAAAQDGIPTVLWSLEMSRDHVMARLVSDVGTVPLTSLIAHSLDTEERDRAKRAADRIAEWPLWVDDTSAVSMAQIRAGCRQMAGSGVGLVVVDYMGLMSPGDRRVPRQEQVAALSGDLKRLAKDLQCPVVVLHQLNRGPEQRMSKRPAMSDMRESGASEQDADIVMLLWRPPDRESELAVIVDKHRNGPTGEVTLDFHGRYARVSSGDPYRNMGVSR